MEKFHTLNALSLQIFIYGSIKIILTIDSIMLIKSSIARSSNVQNC
jgi:hypothetical protein